MDIPDESLMVASALRYVVDPRNHPLLVHCNKGKHRTGCVIGCHRRLEGWAVTSILEEYRRHSAPKNRFMDEQFVELWNPRMMGLPLPCFVQPMRQGSPCDEEWSKQRAHLKRYLTLPEQDSDDGE